MMAANSSLGTATSANWKTICINVDQVHGYPFTEPWFDIGSNYSPSNKK